MSNELAGRGARLGAYLIDVVILAAFPGFLMALFVPMMTKELGDKDKVLMITGAVFGLYALVIFIIQIVLLVKNGQTIGKKVTKVKITLVADDQNGGFFTNVLMRTIVISLIEAIPAVGILFFLVDVCFVFREDRRCVHDLIAKTHVVKV